MPTTNEVTAPQIITKQSAEKRKLSMDFANWVSSSVTLSNAVIEDTLVGGGTSDLIITQAVISGKKVFFFVEGGTNAKSYSIQISVTTSEGEILTGDGMLRVLDN